MTIIFFGSIMITLIQYISCYCTGGGGRGGGGGETDCYGEEKKKCWKRWESRYEQKMWESSLWAKTSIKKLKEIFDWKTLTGKGRLSCDQADAIKRDLQVRSLVAVGWLVDWFVPWFFRWLVGSFFRWLVGSLVGSFVGWFICCRWSSLIMINEEVIEMWKRETHLKATHIWKDRNLTLTGCSRKRWLA